jgi:hypothetical protein
VHQFVKNLGTRVVHARPHGKFRLEARHRVGKGRRYGGGKWRDTAEEEDVGNLG